MIHLQLKNNKIMKHFIITISVLTLILQPLSSGSINYKNKQFALISFNLTIHQQVKEKLDQLSSYFPEVERMKADKIISRIMDYTWFLLEDRLQRELGMYILPTNTAGKQFDYNAYGYPNTSINKAIHRGTSKFYLKIDMSIEPEIIQSFSISSMAKIKKDSSTTIADSTQNQGFKPKIVIDFTSYSEKGIIPIDKFTGTFIAAEPWLFEPKILDGLTNTKECTEQDNLCLLINEAITDLIRKIPTY